jgi:pimeloyl-ACP methyl ester carboxylesterase
VIDTPRLARPRVRRFAVRILGFLTVAGTASAIYQMLADVRDRRRFPPPGRRVDVGGHCFHLTDQGAGSPTVIIVPALGDNVLVWARIQRALAGDTRVCVYDRPGLGWSDSPPRGRRSPGDMAAELHRLLTVAEIGPPYVLAAHSFGGIIARQFVTRYPGSVAGMVLIDSSHEGQARRLGDHWRDGPGMYLRRAAGRQAQALGLRRLAAASGLLHQLDADIAREVPSENAAAARAIYLSSRHRRTVVQEILMMARFCGEPPDLGSLPLTVLTAGTQPPGWMHLQAELAALSANSKHVTVAGAGHYIHVDEPDLVTQSIRDLVARASIPPE